MESGSKEMSVSSDAPSEEGPWCECNRECYRRNFCQMNIYYRTASLALAVIIFLLVGAAIFSALERPNEEMTNEEIVSANEEYNQTFYQLLDTIVNNTNMTRDEAGAIIANLVFSARDSSKQPTQNWLYGPSLFFTMTVVTTIGYGNTAPQTNRGRNFFIVYALVGIPLTLIFLASLGELLKKGMGWLSHPVHKKWEMVWVKILVTVSFLIGGLVLFIIIPAILFSIIQDDWSYFESVYYCFVTLTTVGFGDFVPGIPSSSYHGLYRVSVAAWIFIGLAFLSLVLSLIQDILEKLTKRIQEKRCKCIAKGLKKSEMLACLSADDDTSITNQDDSNEQEIKDVTATSSTAAEDEQL